MFSNDLYKSLRERSYYKQNLEYTNNFVAYILFVASLLGSLFALGTYFSLFDIPYSYCVIIQILGLFLSFTQYILNKIQPFRKYLKFIGLIFISIFTSFVAIVPGVGLSIYIAFILVSFVSTLYLQTEISIITSIVSYILMIISLYINSHFNYITNSMPKIPTEKFFGEFIGYSSTYIFVFIISLSVSNTFKKTLLLEYGKQQKIKRLKLELIETFAHIVEWSDKYTGQHIQRTRTYVELISNKLVEMNYYTTELTPEKIKLFVSAAPLHDIGKINVPNNILSKPGKFTPEEFEIMKTHSKTGYNIIMTDLARFEDIEYIKTASQMALYHHEKWDGTGYPNNVKGTDIPLCGRIMAAADVLDALLSKRQYKEKFTIDDTLAIFEKEREKQFESCIVDAVLALKDDIIKIISVD